MKLLKVKNNKVVDVEVKPFKLEKEIQSLIENNTEDIFELEFIASEFTVGNYRLDSLCYDQESKSFVIIEYKKGNSYSVIDQGYTYLQLLLNNKSDFILKLSHHQNKILKIEEVDWTQSKIIFISQAFNSYQKDSVNFKNLPFELYEIKRFGNDTILLDKHETKSKESIDNFSDIKNNNVINQVNKEIKVYDEDFHLNKTSEALIDKWNAIKEVLGSLENIEINSKKHYISITLNNKAIGYFHMRKSNIVIDIPRGNINVDGSESKNYFSIDDPKGIASERSWQWKSGAKGTIYNISFTKNDDLEYLMFLLKQKVDNLNK